MPFKLDFDELLNSEIKTLYKFKSFDKDNYYKDLLNNSLWLSSRTELNDPLDCRVPYNFELCTEKQIKEKMFSLLPDRYPAVVKIKMVNKQYEHRKNNPELYNNYYNGFIDNRIGVFSLTKDFSPEMWKAYSEDHSGFCIAFNVEKLFNLLDDRFQNTGRRIFIFKVHYLDQLPEVNPCLDSIDEKSQLFLVKTMKWQYENEWRVVCFDGNKVLEPIPPQCLEKIYFGLNAKPENINACKEILKTSNPKIKFYREVKQKEVLGLDFEKFE